MPVECTPVGSMGCPTYSWANSAWRTNARTMVSIWLGIHHQREIQAAPATTGHIGPCLVLKDCRQSLTVASLLIVCLPARPILNQSPARAALTYPEITRRRIVSLDLTGPYAARPCALVRLNFALDIFSPFRTASPSKRLVHTSPGVCPETCGVHRPQKCHCGH